MLTAAYGLDIETDTSRGGLDPRRCRIVAAALATEAYVVVMTGPEKRILANLDDKLARLPDGVLVTWNGSSFDLPFIADRAARLGLRLGLQLRLDPAIVRSHPPLAGHDGSYQASWHGHGHLDAYLAYRSLSEGSGESCALKAVARRAGLRVLEPDPTRIHELSPAQLRRYVANDARLALTLARARWSEVIRGWQALSA